MLERVRENYRRYPREFWVLMAATFIDHIGGFMLFPFFALYITRRFDVGMTEAGGLFAIFAVTSFFGSFLGGAMTDKFGRKKILLFGLSVSGLSSLLMAWVDDLAIFYVIAAFVGLLGNVGEPAQQAMVADMLPEEKRAEGFGLWRVVVNLSATIGPAIGGVLAATSFLWLFVGDAVTSLITAAIVFIVIAETKPEKAEDVPEESVLQTFKGYFTVGRDFVYMAFLGTSIFLNIVYVQMNSTLPVFMRDFHNSPPEYYGYLLSMNAALVVLFQIWVTRQTSKRRPMVMMVVGAMFYMVGFGLYGVVSGLALFAVAMIIITVGEMIVIPIAQVVVAQFAPEDMRGRYMAMFSVSWTIPFAIGPILAGLVMDNFDPRWVWYGAALTSIIAALGYLILHLRVSDRFATRPQLYPMLKPPPRIRLTFCPLV